MDEQQDSNRAGAGRKVLVAVSGGVDSATSAALLLEAGFECAGVFMITNDHGRHAQNDAEKVATHLGIELHVLDLRSEFEEIIEYFCQEYGRGRTPNPCVLCNRRIKFGRLWEFGVSLGMDSLATGHYARIMGQGREAGLYEAAQAAKDQSYVLSQVHRDVLGHVLLPMGAYSKDQVRRKARELGLANAEKADSQEICFIPDDDYVGLLERRRPELVKRGLIVESSGKTLGEHDGTHRFTIGQRRGLRVAMGTPYYVSKLDAVNNQVTLGPKPEVLHRRLSASGLNWLIDEPSSPFPAKVRVRYNDRGSRATVMPGGSCVEIEFEEPKLAITPGQLAVFYVEDEGSWRVAGSAWIDKAMH